MATTYALPEQVYLTFKEDAVEHSVVSTVTNGLQADWRRAFEFMDAGYALGLLTFFGALTGTLTVVDLAYATDYDPTATLPGTGMWLPSDLTPLDGTDLDTTTISIYFAETGISGAVAVAFECVARPARLTPNALQEGLIAVDHAYRWEIRDDSAPVIGS